ncbi:MAG: 16S rRNA (cytosine(1402)-N(4))-methyltransferase RsmH [bacterium]|nr:16S rRNA (cytosine(1402)-N(4))-methyltransferase RsmH [bacterium]
MSRHVPVLLKETIEALNLSPGSNVIDGTLGDAGHAEAILEQTAPNGKLLGIDLDAEAVLRAKRFLYRFEDRLICVRDSFVNIRNICREHKFVPDAIVMDLGWSTPQFVDRGRGFSFNPPAGGDEPLDMRFGGVEGGNITAGSIVNNYSAVELVSIFKRLGEEKFSTEIAATIVDRRKIQPIATSRQLAEIIIEVYRRKLGSTKEIPWIGGLHPATKVFQALRIAVNDELEILKKALPEAVETLKSGGRLAVITFHSLEDRIVKQYFQKMENKTIHLINKKPLVAEETELAANPRARSAKLRVIEKI